MLTGDADAARPREREPRRGRRAGVRARRRRAAPALGDRRGRGLRAAEASRAQGAEGPEGRAVLRLPDPAPVEDHAASRIPTGPWSLERIIEACGGEAIDYPAKIKCCGFPIIQAREETALGELIQPIEQAMEAGADVMVTPCPLCHLSLDAWQSKLKAATGRDFGMPILHLSQLVGVAAGLEESELKFKRHVVSVDAGRSRSSRSERAGSSSRRRRAGGRARAVGVVRGGLGAAARARASPVPGLPPELDGLRIAHLSDFHLGVPSRGGRAVERAVDVGRGAAARTSSCITGDLLTHPRGEAQLRALLRSGCRTPVRVLGNHDLAISRDPFSQPVEPRASSSRARCSRTRAVELELRGRRVEIAGVDPRSWLAEAAERRFAARGRRPPDPALPLPARARHGRAGDASTWSSPATCTRARSCSRTGGKLRLAHPTRALRARASTGAARTMMHVSPGLGTTFVPFRFFARPEATELVLRCGVTGRAQRHLARRPRALRRRRGARGRRRASRRSRTRARA